MPGLRAGPSWRVVSPSGGSILTTSAPRSPSCWAAHGPSTTVVQSRILTPLSGPAIERFLPIPLSRTTTTRPRARPNHGRAGPALPPKHPETSAGWYSFFPESQLKEVFHVDGDELAEGIAGRRRRGGHARHDGCRASPLLPPLEMVATL